MHSVECIFLCCYVSADSLGRAMRKISDNVTPRDNTDEYPSVINNGCKVLFYDDLIQLICRCVDPDGSGPVWVDDIHDRDVLALSNIRNIRMVNKIPEKVPLGNATDVASELVYDGQRLISVMAHFLDSLSDAAFRVDMSDGTLWL